MKKITVIGIVSLLTISLFSSAFASTRVSGYTKKNGTYVAPSYRSSPNKNKLDNYSSKGNYNPYSGKVGTKRSY